MWGQLRQSTRAKRFFVNIWDKLWNPLLSPLSANLLALYIYADFYEYLLVETQAIALYLWGFLLLFNLQPYIWINGHGHCNPALWLGASLHPKPLAMTNQIITLWLKQKPATNHTKQLGQQWMCEMPQLMQTVGMACRQWWARKGKSFPPLTRTTH